MSENLLTLVDKWKKSALEPREAERLTTLLIVDNERADQEATQLIKERDHWEEKATELANDVLCLREDLEQLQKENAALKAVIRDSLAMMRSSVLVRRCLLAARLEGDEIERLNRTIAFLEKQNIKLSKRLLEVLKDG